MRIVNKMLQFWGLQNEPIKSNLGANSAWQPKGLKSEPMCPQSSTTARDSDQGSLD